MMPASRMIFCCCIMEIIIEFTMMGAYRQESKRFKKLVDKKKGGFVIFRQKSTRREYLLLQQALKKQVFEGKWERLWSTPRREIKHTEGIFKTACGGLKEQTGLTKNDVRIIPGFNLTITYGTSIHWNEVTYFLGELNNTNKEIQLSDQYIQYTWLPYNRALNMAEPEEVTRTIILEGENFLNNLNDDN